MCVCVCSYRLLGACCFSFRNEFSMVCSRVFFFCFVRWFSISNLYNAIYTNFVRLECAYHRIRYLKTHKLISIVSYYLYDFRCSILICSDLNRQSKMVFMELNSNKSDNGFYEELGVSHTHRQINVIKVESIQFFTTSIPINCKMECLLWLFFGVSQMGIESEWEL